MIDEPINPIFDHYSIVVSDIDKSLWFYEEFLQLALLPRPEFNFKGAWLRIGSAHALHLIEDSTYILPILGGTRQLHFAFRVDHLLEWRSRSIQYGIPLIKDIKCRPDGIPQLFISDPDGYVIELTSQEIDLTFE